METDISNNSKNTKKKDTTPKLLKKKERTLYQRTNQQNIYDNICKCKSKYF